MRTMDDYTIFCTEEQTKKAFVLGAPIKTAVMPKFLALVLDRPKIITDKEVWYLTTPTTEQMIGWLEKQGILILIDPSQDKFYGSYSLKRNDGYWFNRIFLDGLYPSRKEATLAAIDAALEYLTKNKK